MIRTTLETEAGDTVSIAPHANFRGKVVLTMHYPDSDNDVSAVLTMEELIQLAKSMETMGTTGLMLNTLAHSIGKMLGGSQ